VGRAHPDPSRVRYQGAPRAHHQAGSRLVRGAAIEAVARYHGGDPFTAKFHNIAERPGRTQANVAVARKVLTLVYYGLRDGEIRCLRDRQAA